MQKIKTIAITLGILLAAAGNAQATEISSCGMPDFTGMSTEDIVGTVNASDDELRWCAYERGEMPWAPFGYSYAEDRTLVPWSFWGWI